MDEEQQEQTERKPYHAPQLRVIELVTEEVLGLGCKSSGEGAPTAVCGQMPCGQSLGS